MTVIPQDHTSPLTPDELRQRLHYNPCTGIFTWLRQNRNTKVGQIAGGNGHAAGFFIKIDYIRYHAHRLAWFYMMGQWPSLYIDHVNGNPRDNRWTNLRLATWEQNRFNARRTGRWTNLKGVHKHGKKWQAAIRASHRYYYLGCFDTPEEAHAAYASKARKEHGDFMRLS
jgi:hypothetical protein